MSVDTRPAADVFGDELFDFFSVEAAPLCEQYAKAYEPSSLEDQGPPNEQAAKICRKLGKKAARLDVWCDNPRAKREKLETMIRELDPMENADYKESRLAKMAEFYADKGRKTDDDATSFFDDPENCKISW